MPKKESDQEHGEVPLSYCFPQTRRYDQSSMDPSFGFMNGFN